MGGGRGGRGAGTGGAVGRLGEVDFHDFVCIFQVGFRFLKGVIRAINTFVLLFFLTLYAAGFFPRVFVFRVFLF